MRILLDRLFHLSENKTTVKTEFLAGITTFLAMAYILAVNPAILGDAGMDKGGVLIATALAACFGTMLMMAFANYPFALAPSMGLNAFFAYSVVNMMGYSWQFALFAVFCEGLIFLLLSITPVREKIFNVIPIALKNAISVGIGIFIAFIGLQNAKIVVNSEATLVTMQSFAPEQLSTHGISAILALVGVLISTLLIYKKVPGGILLGILLTWAIGIVAQLVGIYEVDPLKGTFSLLPEFSMSSFKETSSGFSELFASAFDVEKWSNTSDSRTGIDLLLSTNFIVVVFSFLFVDLFSAIGTLTGVAAQANMLDENGRLPKIKGAFMADAIATTAGAVFGTSTTSSYVESAAGVVEGGRTGLSSFFTAILFLLAILLAPIFLTIPAFATAPALIIVGFYMMKPIVNIDFSEYTTAIPIYLTIIVMPLTLGLCRGLY